jgi:hypothetical protein
MQIFDFAEKLWQTQKVKFYLSPLCKNLKVDLRYFDIQKWCSLQWSTRLFIWLSARAEGEEVTLST